MDKQLPSDITHLIDFNLHHVPGPLGLDVPPAAEAAMVNASVDAVDAYRQEAQAEVSAAAREFLSQQDARAALEAWSLARDETVLFLGDSITTYLYSYARLLQSMVLLQQGAGGARFLNGAQSGYTSTHGLEAAFTLFLKEQPNRVFIKFGANDCKQFGGPQAKTLVSAEEYRANLRAMIELFQKEGAQVVVLAPTPVVEAMVNANPEFQAMRMTWHNANLQAFGAIARELAGEYGCRFVDLQRVFGAEPDPALYLDGLHPNRAGQRLILDAVLQALQAPAP